MEKSTQKELELVIERKDKEISDVKASLLNILQEIRDINESTDCNDFEDKRRRISELCTDTIYELTFDVELENAKIIELPTRQSKK